MSLKDINYTFPDIDNYDRKGTNIKTKYIPLSKSNSSCTILLPNM